MKIRHLSPPEGYYAAYLLDESPWVSIEPLLYLALVDRDGESRIVGMLVDGPDIVAVDDLEGFHSYWRPRSRTAEEIEQEYTSLFNTLQSVAYEQYLAANPHMRQQEPTPVPSLSRRRRRTGSGEPDNE